MSPSRKTFQDDFENTLRQGSGMSDDELEALMGLPGQGKTAGARKATDYERLETGARVRGVVVEVRGQEVLVELDGKTLGVIELEEYGDGAAPSPGAKVQADFVRYDRGRDICLLSMRAVRTELAWEELRPGLVLEGNVVETNKGGLTIDIRGLRAFMPVSQIDTRRVEDLEEWVGRKVCCEVTRVDRAGRDLVVSRRAIVARDQEAERAKALDRIQRGDVIRGAVVRVSEHGAFIDLGGVDGLLHASKIHRQVQSSGSAPALRVGDQIEVEVAHVDKERGRVGLDFRSVEAESWDTILEGYAVGDEVTGWITKAEAEGAILAIEDGVQTFIPGRFLPDGGLEVGAIVHGAITHIDREARRIEVKPHRR